MLIIPTEKRFDARRAPWVLISLIIINCVVFFAYQSQDSNKQYAAIEQYLEAEFLDIEYPLFQQYLVEQDEKRLLAELDQWYQADEPYIVASYVLYYQGFYDFVERRAQREFEPDVLRSWRASRYDIQQQFAQVSSIAHGLISSDLRIPAFFTYQFLHGSIDHLLGNLLFLMIFGFAVEAAIGHARFLVFYLLSGVAAGLAQVVMTLDSSVPLIGASGSISGVMAMYLAVFRLRKIEFFYWVFFFVGYLRAPALLILPFYFGKEIYSYLSDVDSNVAFMAHAGGIAGGTLLIAGPLFVSPNIINQQYIEEDQSYTARQQALAKVYKLLEKFRFKQALAAVNELVVHEALDIELALLRFHLAKVNPDKHFPGYLRELFLMPALEPAHLDQQAKAWQQYGRFAKLTTEQQLAFAIRLASAKETTAAQSIHDQLFNASVKPKGLNLLTKKLLDRFVERQDRDELSEYKRRYQQIAQELGHGHL